MLSTALFQFSGKGISALTDYRLRTAVFIPFFAAFSLNMEQEGAWWGIATGNIIRASLTFLWARLYVSRLLKMEHLKRSVEYGV